MRILPALVLLLAAPPAQDALTLAQVMEKMEAAASGSRGTTFRVASSEASGMMAALVGGGTGEVDVAISKNGVVRVHTAANENSSVFGMNRNSPGRDVILGEDGVCIIEEFPAHATGGYLRRKVEKIAAAAADSFDPFASVSAWGFSSSVVDGVILLSLSPKRTFAFERGLELIGKRTIGSEEFYVILSRRKLADAAETGMPFQGVTKKFYVSLKDFRLRRVEERFASTQVFQDMKMTWRLDEWASGVPGKISLTMSYSSIDGYEFSLPFETSDVKTGQDPAAAAPDGELYATHAHDPNLPKLLQQSPDDAQLNWSFAVHAATEAGSPMAMAMGRAVDSGPIAAALEKVLAKSPSPTVVRNLLALYAQRKEIDKLAALVETIEKNEKRTAIEALDAAEALNALGKHDRALALLDKLEGVSRTRIAEERIHAFIAKGDLAKAIAEVASIQDPAWVERLVALAEQLPDEVKKAIPRADLIKALDAAITAGSTASLHVARLRVLSAGEELDQLAAAIKAAFEQTNDKVVDQAAFSILDAILGTADPNAGGGVMVIGPGQPAKPKIEPEKVKASIKAFIAAIEAAGSRTPARIALGQARKIAGDKEGAAKDFIAACDAVAKLAGKEALDLSGCLVRELADFGDDALLEKACKLHLAQLPRGGSMMELMMGMRGGNNPLGIYIKYCTRTKKFVDLYQSLKGMEFGGWMTLPMLFMQEAQGSGLKEFFAAAKEEALRDSKDLAGIKWLAKQAQGNSIFGERADTGIDPVELYEKAHEWAPKDLEALQALADLYAKKNDRTKAVKACEEVIEALKTGSTCDKPWSPARALMTMADLAVKAGDAEGTKAVLAKLDLGSSDVQPWELWHAGELLEGAAMLEEAAAALRRLEPEGYRPYVKLAALYTAQKNWTEAMRNLNRAIAFGFDAQILGPQSFQDQLMGRRGQPDEKKEATPESLRADLLKKVGDDYFIERLMESKLPALSDEDAKRAKDAFAKVSSDDVGDREEGIETLRKIGPACAAIIKPGLKSGDDEVKLRIRTLMNDWAEPR